MFLVHIKLFLYRIILSYNKYTYSVDLFNS